MNSLSNTVADGFVHYYRDFAERVNTLAEKLTEGQFWEKPYPYGNSFGNLVLHLTGNLNYYIGAQIAGTGYVRERELEFTTTQFGQKDETLRKLDAAVRIVIDALRAESDGTWEQAYEAAGVEEDKNRFSIYLRCAVHFHHHVGQMIYLVEAFSDET